MKMIDPIACDSGPASFNFNGREFDPYPGQTFVCLIFVFVQSLSVIPTYVPTCVCI